MAALLELMRLFSRLASQPGQSGLSHFNLVFALTGGGKLNFLGSKKILEDQLDGIDGGLFQVLCYGFGNILTPANKFELKNRILCLLYA